jgi:hypothetical protein
MWGIFDQSGNPVLTGDSVDSFSFQRDARVSTAPQEQGAFMSYNKVQEPYAPRVTYAIGEDRTDFLDQVDAAVQSLDLYVVTTPDKAYPNANLVHYDYTRTQQQGVTLLLVSVWLNEIRQGTGPQLTNTKSMNGASPKVTAQVQVEVGDITTPDGTPVEPVSTPGGGTPPAPPPPTTPTPTPTPGADIPPPNIGAPDVPIAPSTWNTTPAPVQNAVVTNGVNGGATQALVYPPGPDGASAVTFIGGGQN